MSEKCTQYPENVNKRHQEATSLLKMYLEFTQLTDAYSIPRRAVRHFRLLYDVRAKLTSQGRSSRHDLSLRDQESRILNIIHSNQNNPNARYNYPYRLLDGLIADVIQSQQFGESIEIFRINNILKKYPNPKYLYSKAQKHYESKRSN